MTGAEGAYYNVLINLAGLKDLDQSEAPTFVADTRTAAAETMARCEELAGAARGKIREQLEDSLDG